MWTFEFYQSIFQKVRLTGLHSLWQKRLPKFSLGFYDSTNIYLFSNIKIKWYLSSNYQMQAPGWLQELISDFPGLRYLCSLIDLSSLRNLNGLGGLKSHFPSKNFRILMISSPLAPKWPILVPFWRLDHQKSKFLLILGNFSVRGCWGQPILLFWK